MPNEADYPGMPSQLLLLFCTAGTLPGTVFGLRGSWLLQTFFLSPPCASPLNASAANCCLQCLGLSEFQYGWINGLPSWFAAPFVFLSGALLDRFGLPSTAIGLAALAVLGAFLHVVATFFVLHHRLVLALLVAGKGIIEIVSFAVLTIRQYVAGRFCGPKYQPLAIGILFTVSSLGGISGGMILPRVAKAFGLRLAFWAMTAGMAFSLLFAIGFTLIYHRRSDVARLEVELKSQNSEFKDAYCAIHRQLAGFKAFAWEYWLIAVELGTIFALITVTAMNTQLLQKRLLHIPVIRAAEYQSLGWVAQTVLVPSLSVIINFLPCRIVFAVLVCAAHVLSYVVLIAPHGNGLAHCVLISLSFPISLVALSPMMKDYVPTRYLGMANSSIYAFSYLIHGLLSATFGGILNLRPKRTAALIAVYFLTASMLVPVLLIAILMWRRRSAVLQKDGKEFEQLIDKSEAGEPKTDTQM